MRPIRLKMSAFGAYVKPIELDFAKGLGENNFFLINGATGSGKTTILDAICYALYGESSGGGRTGKMMRSEQATATDKTEIEFEFALRGKNYRIKRNPKYMRARIRGEGMTEEKATAEIYENGRFIATKDVTKYVKELLQFDCEQFRQVIILPQGEFKKFLVAKSDEKQKVLNMLFNAEFFKKVEEKLKIRASDAKKCFDELELRRKNYLDEAECSEEEFSTLIKNLAAELAESQSKLKNLATEAEKAQKNYGDGEKISSLFAEMANKTQELSSAQEILGKIVESQRAAQIEFDKRQSEEELREKLKLEVSELGKKRLSLRNLQSKRRELEKALSESEESADKVKRLEKLKKDCDKTMKMLKSEVEKLADSPTKLKVAEQKLKEAQKREKLLTEIKNLRGDVKKLENELISAEKLCDEAEKVLSELREAQKSGSASRLALTLADGEPCPVCGAIHHPNPAKFDASIPTDAQIKAAESKLKALSDKKSSVEKKLSELKGELGSKEKNLSEIAEKLTADEAQAEYDKISADVKKLAEDNARIKRGEAKIADTEEKLALATDSDKKISALVENLRGELNNMLREIDEKYYANPKLLEVEINSTQKRLDELNLAFRAAQDKINRLNRELAAQNAKVEALQKNKAEISAKIEGKTLPDMELLKKIRDDTRAAHTEAIESKTKISERLARLKVISDKICALKDELTAADAKYLMWKTLSDAASGKISRISFQRYYLATMFKEVIIEANNRLEKMSGGRYRFQNKAEVTDKRYSGGLDLEIFDDYTGTARPVETLSGGESFLASLSLALGLAAVVQNNSGGIKLETIFIDEGFGTLDSETLDFAMKTLMELQNGGRLVGIISHVEELKNQMPVRLEVFKTKTGSTAKFIR